MLLPERLEEEIPPQHLNASHVLGDSADSEGKSTSHFFAHDVQAGGILDLDNDARLIYDLSDDQAGVAKGEELNCTIYSDSK